MASKTFSKKTSSTFQSLGDSLAHEGKGSNEMQPNVVCVIKHVLRKNNLHDKSSNVVYL